MTGQLELGGRYQIDGNAEGSILKCDPPDELEMTWGFGGQVSWVRVLLTQEAGGTKLTLEHAVPKDEVAEEHWKQFGPGATGVGWDLSLLGLALHLDSGGQPIDQDRNNAWMVSEGGKAFLRTCADGWREAHVDAGEEPGVAEAMARRTTDFYTNS